jgi:hypothetical protein
LEGGRELGNASVEPENRLYAASVPNSVEKYKRSFQKDL